MKQNETTQSFDVIIIGGGATGAGTARAMPGLWKAGTPASQ